VRRRIAELGAKIRCLEEKVEAAEAANDEKKLERRSSELKLLREEKNLLMQKELKLMDQRGAAEGQSTESLRACTDASGHGVLSVVLISRWRKRVWGWGCKA
jgi:hypothetical protein